MPLPEHLLAKRPLIAFLGKDTESGLTLLELMVAIAIIGILAAIAFPNYLSYLQRARYVVAVSDIKNISQAVDEFAAQHHRYPNDLAEIGMANLRDPWGNPYQYLNVANEKGKGNLRKDRSLVPVNSDYDLYSMGADGKSLSPFTAQPSLDDIVRAHNGSYLGYAENY
jgi:general secretion pathway protein G